MCLRKIRPSHHYHANAMLIVFVKSFLFLSWPSASAETFAASNLVINGSFEQIRDGRIVAWQIAPAEGVIQNLFPDLTTGRDHAARLECVSFLRTNRTSLCTVGQARDFGIRQGHWYRFSCQAHSKALVGGMVTVELTTDTQSRRPDDTIILFLQMPVTSQWKRFEKVFQATCSGTVYSRLAFWYDETGILWLDDVELCEVPPVPLEFTDTHVPGEGKNLLPNGSFECGSDGWSSLGQPLGWAGGLVGLDGEIQKGGASDGAYCLRIDMGPGKTPLTSFDLYPVTCRYQTAPLAATVGWVKVEKGLPYTLSAYLRANRPQVKAVLKARFSDPAVLWLHEDFSTTVTLTTEWQRYFLTVTPTRNFGFVAVGPDMSETPESAATVWIDAVQFQVGNTASDYETRDPIEIGAATNRFGNVFDGRDNPGLTINASNRTPKPGIVPLRLEMEDFFDRRIFLSTKELEIPPHGNVVYQWPLPLTNTGFYRAKLSWESSGRQHAKILRLALVKPFEFSESVFGVNHAPATNELCRLLKKAGVLWAREWALCWQDIEPQPGQYQFGMADKHCARLLDQGLSLVQLLPPFPSSNWISSATDIEETCFPSWFRPWCYMAYAPQDTRALERFATQVVRHYQPRIKYWEFLNEPLYTIHSLPSVEQMDANLPCVPHAAYTVENYISLLKVLYPSVKAADPQAFVIGGLGGRPDLLTKQFFDSGGLNYVDIFNLHIYPGQRKPETYIPAMEKLLADMDRCPSGRKPIWMTECAYFAGDDLPWKPFVVDVSPWAANRLLRDEKQCADYTVRFVIIMLAHGVDKIFYHNGAGVSSALNDEIMSLEAWMTAPLGQPRKTYAAQSALANILGPHPQYVGIINKPAITGGLTTDGLYGYAFQDLNQSVVVIWAPDAETRGCKWRLSIPPGAQALSIMGSKIEGDMVILGESPVYLVSTVVPARNLANILKYEAVEQTSAQ
jgi:hypothetical protein